MKREYIALIGAFLITIMAFSAVYVYNTRPAAAAPNRLKVLATFYPVYDFAKNVGGDRIDLSLLVPMTVDVHEFEPTPSSVQEVVSANVLSTLWTNTLLGLKFSRELLNIRYTLS